MSDTEGKTDFTIRKKLRMKFPPRSKEKLKIEMMKSTKIKKFEWGGEKKWKSSRLKLRSKEKN
jgi:hypothetical protein